MGESTRLHSSLPAPWDGELARALELLQGADAHVEGAHRCHCWRSVSFPHHRWSHGSYRKDGGKLKLGEERKQQKGMHTMKEADMFATKMDLLLKRMDERAHEKEAMKATV